MAAEEAPLKTQIRVVRCPKCEKFLPELPYYSVYICGNCGAKLQAKRRNQVSDPSPEKSAGDNVKYLEVVDGSPEKKEMLSEESLEAGTEGHGVVHCGGKESASGDKEDAVDTKKDSENAGCQTVSSMSKLDDPPKAAMEATDRKYRRAHEVSAGGKAWKEKVGARQPIYSSARSPRILKDGIQPNCRSEDGPSARGWDTSDRYVGGRQAERSNMDGPSRVGCLEKDRAELLRMLDDLREQVQRSCEVSDKKSRYEPAIGVMDPSSSYSPRDQLAYYTQERGSTQLTRDLAEQIPAFNSHDSRMPHFYEHDDPGYMEPFAKPRAPVLPSGQHPWRRSMDNHFYNHLDSDPFISHHHRGFYHQPACSCFHCHPDGFSLPPAHGEPLVNPRRVSPYPMNSRPAGGTLSFGMPSYDRVVNASLHQNSHKSIIRKYGRILSPTAAAAPFTICHCCFELLELPRRSLLQDVSQYKVRCGSCFRPMVVKISGNKLDISVPGSTSRTASKSDGSTTISVPRNDPPSTDEKLHPTYNFSMDNDDFQEQEMQMNLSESEEKMDVLSSSSSMSAHRQSTNTNGSQSDVGHDPRTEAVQRMSSLPLCEHFVYTSDTAGSGKGNKSSRSEQEKVVLLTENFKQNSVKDVLVASDMDMLSSEFPDQHLSPESFDAAQQGQNLPRATRGGDSFISNLIRKSFKFHPSAGNDSFGISVNGYHLSHRTVKKAEKKAGPISPGDYWYDYRAGFWGVMGHPCLGMIPPFIEEFNYPMPTKCAGGNTDVLVNGRELHQKDLDLLVSRGLDDAPGRSYRIEISGKVCDEISSEELCALGKLAPTIEKMKRGFGMRIPKVLT